MKFIRFGAMDVTRPLEIHKVWGHGCHQTLYIQKEFGAMDVNRANNFKKHLGPWMSPDRINLKKVWGPGCPQTLQNYRVGKPRSGWELLCTHFHSRGHRNASITRRELSVVDDDAAERSSLVLPLT